MKRLLLLFLALSALVVVPFLIWGEAFEANLSTPGLVETMRSAGGWAWLVGIALLMADLLLPIPGTAVMSALGLVYGGVVGGLLSALGSIASGMLAYTLCFWLGRGAARFLTGEKGLEEGERFFHGELGGWTVALSRWMPVLPEVVACLAGISRMPMRRFFPALCVGSVPMGFVFAAIGAGGEARPLLALALSAALPPVVWFALRALYRLKQNA